jgi:hypothetical protein
MTITQKTPDMNVAGYETLADVLARAYDQAARGKGKERHAQDLPFDQQPMQTISQLVGSADGLRYQAIKKIQEAPRLSHDAGVRELLGAIVYLAGAIIHQEQRKAQEPKLCGEAAPMLKVSAVDFMPPGPGDCLSCTHGPLHNCGVGICWGCVKLGANGFPTRWASKIADKQ